MSKRSYDTQIVNTRPKKITRAQQQRAYNQLGFVQGGRFMRSAQMQARLGSRPGNYLPNNSGSLRKADLKAVDFQVDIAPGGVLATTNTNGGIALCNAIQPGTGSWNRIGKNIRMKSLRYKGILQCQSGPTNALGQNTIRVVLIFDKNPNSGAIPTYDQIFGSTSQLGTESTQSFLDNQRIDNTQRFSVLKDDVYTSLNPALPSATLSTEWQCSIDTFVKLKGLQTTFSGQSNPCTIADVSSGALYLAFRCEQNSTASQWEVKNTTCRLRYYD